MANNATKIALPNGGSLLEVGSSASNPRCLPKGSVKRSDKNLGHGGFSVIYKGTYDNKTVAIKVINMWYAEANEVHTVVQNELKLLHTLRESDLVIRLLGYYHDTDFVVWIVMEYAENGDLAKFLNKSNLKGLWLAKARICADIAKSVDAVHHCGVTHGDLKASNVLIDVFLKPKLADFGHSKTFTSILRGSLLGQTIRYTAPERLCGDKNMSSEQLVLADIYSFGMIVWQVVTDGRLPYGEDCQYIDLFGLKMAAKDNRTNSNWNPLDDIGDFSDDVPPTFKELVHACLATEPSRRPSFAQIQQLLGNFLHLYGCQIRQSVNWMANKVLASKHLQNGWMWMRPNSDSIRYQQEISGITWETMKDHLQGLIGDIYSEHRYLWDSLEKEEQDEFKRIMNVDENFPRFETALRKLTKYLTRYHQSQCVVLIDEYDAPLEKAFNLGYYNKASEFLEMLLLSLLKDNSYLHKALLVGVFRIAKTGFLSGLNNPCINSMTSKPFADKFGFTKDEVDLLLHRHKVNIPIDHAHLWYNGYRSGNGSQQYKLFNPRSVIFLCAQKVLKTYWSDTDVTSRITKLLPQTSSQFKKNVLQLISRNAINVASADNVIYEGLDMNNDNYIWTLLYYAGYITNDDRGNLIIPNYECWMEWVNWITPGLCNTNTIIYFFKRLIEGDTYDINQFLQNATKQFLLFGGGMHEIPKSFHQDFIVNLLFPFSNEEYNVYSKREAPDREYDILVLPTVHARCSEVGVAMKLKVAADNETEINASVNALHQIRRDRGDFEGLNNVKTVLIYAIGYKGEAVHVEMVKVFQG
ncbi:kinase-like domain-containing protein [Jimgerdemannia flammicorona]|uniref:Kinase-like domain-containing protein n=1 Tax=Jimgerdemannia flammicorona TaxID=994334 RepID=A0A433QUR9_9FUNG|nr:kinase-like domain-containing protein [Jimgerdemannia flammicorona]